MPDSVSPDWTVYVRPAAAAGLAAVTTASVCTTSATAAGPAGDTTAASAACGATATRTPAMATAGAALPAAPATFSTCDGVVCLPVRRIFRGRACVWAESTELPK